MRASVILAALALFSLAAAKPTLQVSAAEVRVPAGGQTNAAAYLTLYNPTGQADRLVGAACDCARAVTLHRSVVENGIARMTPLKAIDAPPKAEVDFTATGHHLMLEGLKRPIKAGDKLTLTLSFQHAAPQRVAFTAGAMAGMAGMSGMGDIDRHHGHN